MEKIKNKENRKHVIYLDKAARYWDDGLPVGNGRLGAMVMGKPDEETIFLNEETLWYGPDRDRKNPDTFKYLEDIRSLLFAGEVQKAQFLAKMAMTSAPKYMNPYQPAGDMRICFYDHKYPVSDYARWLDLDEGVAYVQYSMQGIAYKREHFVSHNYQVAVIRLSAGEPGKLTLCVNMSRKPFEENTGRLCRDTVCNYGECGPGGVHYFTGIKLTAKGGSVDSIGDFTYVEGADEVTIYAAVETDYQQQYEKKAGTASFHENENRLSGEKDLGKTNQQDQEADFVKLPREYTAIAQRCMARLNAAAKAGYEKIRREHKREYHLLFDRMELRLGDWTLPDQPMNQLLEELKGGRDENLLFLTEMLFVYARYLMISSSFDCLMPSNLQGIWNGEYAPPWQCEFTININTEMNYWIAEKCGLPECHLPLFEQVKRMIPKGQETAKKLYGCHGFCAHHNTNLWGNTDPEGIFDASPFWPMGGAWLALHFYEHYCYTQDKKFLREQAVVVMQEAIAFFEDYLCESPKGGLVTGPSLSPENTYLSSIGAKGALCMGPAMDIQILRQLFSNYLEACKILGLTGEESKSRQVEDMLKKLPPDKITSDGRIMEWQQEYQETEPGHRHISHLFALHPGHEITPQTPKLFAAARRTLEERLSHGGGHTGWSRAWITCFYARLRQGESVQDSIRTMLCTCIKNNLLDTHPPFQIDGNFGIAEAMAESLVQSHAKALEFLPALPPLWDKGCVKGMVLRGGISASFSWEQRSLTALELTAVSDTRVIVTYNGQESAVSLKAGEKTNIDTILQSC